MAKLRLGKTEITLLARMEEPHARRIGFIGADTAREMNAARALCERGLVDIQVFTSWAYRNRGTGSYHYCTRETFSYYRVFPGTGQIERGV